MKHSCPSPVRPAGAIIPIPRRYHACGAAASVVADLIARRFAAICMPERGSREELHHVRVWVHVSLRVERGYLVIGEACSIWVVFERSCAGKWVLIAIETVILFFRDREAMRYNVLRNYVQLCV